MKHTLCFVWFFFFAFSLSAQQTAVYTDELRPFNTATELYQQKKYGAALKQYNRFIDYAESNSRAAAFHEQYLDALFYRAQSANELDQPQAEKYFLDLVAYHESTPVTRMANFYLGNIYYKQKKYDNAIAWFTKVSAADLSPDQLNEYRFQLGYCYFFKKKFDQAEALFQVVKEVKNKYYYPANYYYGYIAYTQGDYAAAQKSFDVVKDTRLYAPVIPYYTASIHYMQNRYQMAIDHAQKALQNDKLKYHDELKQLIGKSYFQLGQYDKALPYLKDYYDKVSKSNKADIYQVGYSQYKLGQYGDAVKSFTQLSSQRDSLGQSALFLLGDSYLKTKENKNARNAFLEASRIAADKTVQEDASFQYAKLSYELGYQDVATKATQDYLTNYPKSKKRDEALELLTNIFISTNNYRDAVTAIQSIENKTPALKIAYQRVAFGRALQLYNERQYAEALKLFEVSLNNPIDLTTQALSYYWKGESYYQLKKYMEANLNYFKFIEATRLVKDLPYNASAAAGYYGIGYAYLGRNDYDKALQYFEQSRAALPQPKTKDERAYYDKVFPDCMLRIGDCYFTQKNYSKASDAYTSVISAKQQGTDYALLQRGMIHGLTGNMSSKIADLTRLTNEFGTSVYQDDAMFEIGDTHLKNELYEDAILVFNRIVNDYPSSSFVKNAHLKLGLIYFNTKRMPNALESYRTVAKRYPNTPESRDAIDGIREIYLAQGDANGLVKELDAIPNAGVSMNEKDSLVYEAAQRRFSAGDCDGALQRFGDYINAYPNGAFIADARYYRATCLFQNKDYNNALADFEFIITRNDTRFLEKALLHAGRIELNLKHHDNALKHYTRLQQVADFKENKAEARRGIMLSAFELKQYEPSKKAANEILADGSAPVNEQNEATYLLGRMAMDQQQYAEAITYFTKVSKETKTELGAKSTYYIAEAYYKQNDLKNAESWAYKVINQTPTQDYWLAKSYLLIADIFMQQNDLFNAKATLQSLIENYKAKDDIVPAAEERLRVVMARESQSSKVETYRDELEAEPTPSNDIQP